MTKIIYMTKNEWIETTKTLKLQHREGFEVRSPILQPAGDLLVPRGRGWRPLEFRNLEFRNLEFRNLEFSVLLWSSVTPWIQLEL